MVRGLYTTCTPTQSLRKPTRPARGAYASTSQLPGAYAGASVQVQCSFGSSGSKIRNAAQVRIPHLSKNLAARKGLRTRKCLESLREYQRGACVRRAYAEPTRRLQNKQKEGKRSTFLHTWQTTLSHDLFNKRLREKPTRGVTQQPTR